MKNWSKICLLIAFWAGLSATQAQPAWSVNGEWLNRAVSDGRVDSVWKGIGLPEGFSGKDVIIGITDWGFDYSHPVFYDTAMNRYRILGAWDQFRNEGPAPQSFNYGTEIMGKDRLLQYQSDTSNVYFYGYHGTHVASIAGGAGAGTPYRGVACDADLLLVTFLVDEQAVIDGFNWMFEKAQEVQKRLVINMSWGLYYMGNMDGSGRLAETMQQLSEQGVVFVTSAGNNGDVYFHLSHTFSGDADTLKSVVNFDNMGHYAFWGQSVSMTSSPNTPFSFALHVMNSGFGALATTPFYSTEGGDRYIDTFLVVNADTVFYNIAIETEDPYSHRPEVRFRVKKSQANYKMGLMATASAGEFHAFNVVELTTDVGNWGDAFVANAAWPGSVAGDRKYGLGMPASVECAITVAAHQSEYRAGSGNLLYGNIAYFSSHGPTIDGRIKPEISAPGYEVGAALSSYTTEYSGSTLRTITFNNRSYKFVPLSGTSMSSPFVAGVTALILQVNPHLSAAQVKQIIIETARQDSWTGQQGAEAWFGNGKINAYAAVQKALQTVGTDRYPVAESRYAVFPNPAAESCYVTVQNNLSTVKAELLDMTGRTVRAEQFAAGVNTLNLSGLPPALYMLKLTDDKHTATMKIIKK
ncbi:MAG: S8 family peptidase [Bacteroidales bacterium]|jgi:subtilisin family serine protease|nr:S8 family peptidase [Bacteroidales bacterium]